MIKEKETTNTVQEIMPVILLHTSCKTLNVAGFKECYCNNNYKPLIIDGEPADEDLINAWNGIVLEYGSAIKTENSVYIFDLQKRIDDLKIHIDIVDRCLLVLERRFSKIAVDELIELGYDGIYQFDDDTQYKRQLNRIRGLCKTRVMDLCELQDEYDRYTANSTNGKQPTEEEFEEWMADLGRFQHHPIDQDATKVIQWIGIINAFIKAHTKKQPQPTDG